MNSFRTLFILLALLLPTSAWGQLPQFQCNTHERIIGGLLGQYQEAPVAMGVTGAGALLEVLTSPGGGTWTIIVTASGGPTCIISAGEG